MKKSRKLLFTLLAALLVICVLIAVACEPPAEDEEPTDDTTSTVTTDSVLITNGTFATATGASSAYVKTNVTGWSISTDGGSWLNTAAGLTYGVIDLDRTKFDTNRNAINASVEYPGIDPQTPKDDEGNYKDTNALVISMSKSESYGSIYYAASKSVSLESGKYYKLSIDVWTDLLFDDNDTEKRGAAIVIGGDVFTEYLSVNTENHWKTYEVIIEGNDFESRTMSIQLWLGHGPSTLYKTNSSNNSEKVDNPYLAKGTVMFDNIVIEELEVEEGVCDAYETALQENLEALYPVGASNPDNKTRVLGLSAPKANEAGLRTVVSLKYPDPNFTAYMPYDAHTTNSSYIKSFYSAKVGDAENYTWILGKDKLEDSSEFPSYSTIPTSYKAYSTDPRGIFDISKLYEYEDGNYVDTYNKINSNFHAPAADEFYDLGGEFKIKNGSLDNKALLIYHTTNKTGTDVTLKDTHPISGAGYVSDYNILIESNKYYEISVWVYMWVPDYTLPEEPTGEVTTRPTDPSELEFDNDDAEALYREEYEDKLSKYNTYNTKLKAWEAQKEYYETSYKGFVDGSSKVHATFRLSGATTDTKISEESTGGLDQWEKITLYVKGNELANRQLRMEFWYGEGEWGTAGLYPGGCFFDNLSIKVSDTADPTAEYKSLSVISTDEYKDFNLTPDSPRPEFTAITEEGTDGWKYALIDNKTDESKVQVGFIGGAYAEGDVTYTAAALDGITAPGTFELSSTKFDVVMLRHTDFTASTLTFMPENFMQVNPNKFYRLSMWINTQGLTAGSTFKISVYDRKTDAIVNSSATVSGISVTEWTEISILIKGSATASKELYLFFEFGSGDIYTPASHTKGAVFITACTFYNVEYSEYDNATTGTYVKKVSLSESSSSSISSSSISNSDFSSIADSNFSDTDKVDEVFSNNSDEANEINIGDIIGVATPSSWTLNSATNVFGTVSLSQSGSTLSWNEVNPEVTVYYVFMNGFKSSENTKEDNVLVGKVEKGAGVESDGVRKFSFTVPASGTYYVRAYAEIDGKKYTSAASGVKTITGITGTAVRHSDHATVKEYFDTKIGVVNAEKYNKTGLGADFYATGTDMGYRSTASKNLLMVYSPYETYAGYKSTSSTLSSDSYYRLSVWVKTIGDAKASVTLANNSNALSINRKYDEYQGGNADKFDDHIGYINISTGGAWVRYDLYISTNMSSATLNLELGLGTSYAQNYTIGEGDKAAKASYGLSSGTVYFDDVMLTKLDGEAAFNSLVYGIEDIDITGEEIAKILKDEYGVEIAANDVNALTIDRILKEREDKSAALSNRSETATFFTNNYKFRVVNYYVNSFDNYTDDISDGSKQGYTPTSYNHHNTYSAVSGTDSAPNIIYGVYDKTKIEDAFVSYICSDDYAMASFGEDKVKSFLTTNIGDTGNNMYLMLANVQEATGQYYQSTSFSMNTESYYKITFNAKLLSVDNKDAEFRLVYDNTNGYWETVNIVPSEYMQDYTFFYYNENTSTQSIYLNFTLGSNDAQGTADRVKNDVAGILIIDDVAITKLDDSTEYDDAVAKINDGSTARLGAYKNEATTVDSDGNGDGDGEEDTNKENSKNEVNPQVWLIISSVVIGVILIAVVVVLVYRKLKGRVVKKLRKTKVESNVPVDLEEKSKKPKVKGDSVKTNINADDYDD